MVDRAHFEQSFAVGELEVADLEHDREHLAEINDSERKKQDRHSERERESAYHSAEEKRARVAHKHLCRVEIPHKEPEAGACYCGAESRYPEVIQAARDEHYRHCREECYRAVKTVDTVGQINGVNYADYHDGGDYIVEETEINSAYERDYGACSAAREAQNGEVNACRRELENELLNSGKSEVALFNDLCVVVDKADKSVCERESETGEDVQRLAADIRKEGRDELTAEQSVRYRAEKSHDGDRQDEHDAAHDRRALLALMPLGTLLADRLSEVDLVQKRYQKLTRHG